MPRLFKPLPDTPQIELPELPDELWLKIYCFLHPIQLVEYALINRSRFRVTQTREHYQSVVWKTKFAEANPRGGIFPNYRLGFQAHYKSKLSRLPDAIRKLYIYTEAGDRPKLKACLDNLVADSTFNPGVFFPTRENQEDALIWAIRNARNQLINDIYYDAIYHWYEQKSKLTYPSIWPFKIDTIKDSAGNHLMHWEVVLAPTKLHPNINRFLTSVSDSLLHTCSDPINSRGQTLAHLAATMGNVTFLSAKENVYPEDTHDSNGHSVFNTCVRHGQIDCMNVMMQIHHINFAGISYQNSHPLSVAAKYGHNEAIQTLLSYAPEKLTFEPENWRDAFLFACAYNQPHTAQLLVDLMPAHYFESVIKGTQRCWLGDRPSDIPYISFDGEKVCWNVLLHATLAGHEKIVAFLITQGADINQMFNTGNNANWSYLYKREYRAIHYAAEEGNATAVKILIKYGATLDVTTASGKTPLQLAAPKAHLRYTNVYNVIVDLLEEQIKMQADVEEPPTKRQRRL